MIPEAALVPERSKQFVFVVSAENVAQLREIQTGRRRPGEVEVLKGLSEGERLITEGTQKARDGQAVQVLGEDTSIGGR
jgi:membrane fusion protein (multidrug efflux system)